MLAIPASKKDMPDKLSKTNPMEKHNQSKDEKMLLLVLILS